LLGPGGAPRERNVFQTAFGRRDDPVGDASKSDGGEDIDDWVSEDQVSLGRLSLTEPSPESRSLFLLCRVSKQLNPILFLFSSSSRLRALLSSSSRPPMLVRDYSALDLHEVGGGASSLQVCENIID